mmetsp:Transcript_6540/g.24293  ORF Transcript_6540/g.24293 Transcript_6540/m.24293 type:complete len:470 (-) Transcript_6540:416-1825(-)
MGMLGLLLLLRVVSVLLPPPCSVSLGEDDLGHRLDTLGGLADGLVGDDLGSQLAGEDCALHGAQVELGGVVACEHEVLYGSLLRGAELVAAHVGGVDGARRLDDGVLAQLRAGTVRLDLRGEKALQFAHGGLDDLLVGSGDPVLLRARERPAWCKDELQHGLLLVVVLFASRGHVGVHREQRRAREHEVVAAVELAVEPEVQVDHGDALQLVELLEERALLPRLGRHKLHDVHGHRGDVHVGGHLLPARELQVGHALAVLRNGDLAQRGLQAHLPAPRLHVLTQRLAQAVGLVAVQEGHLRAVRLVDEAVHRGEHHRHAQLVRVDEVQRLGHRDENLVVHPVGHVVLLHPLAHRQLVLRVDVVLPRHQHGQQRQPEAQLLRPREHLVVVGDRPHPVPGRWQPRREVEARKLARGVGHREDHGVLLPLQAVLDVELREQVHHVRVRPEEDVQPCLDPVTVLVLPSGHLAA